MDPFHFEGHLLLLVGWVGDEEVRDGDAFFFEPVEDIYFDKYSKVQPEEGMNQGNQESYGELALREKGAVSCVAAVGSAHCGAWLILIELDHRVMVHAYLALDHHQSDHQREPGGGGGDEQDAWREVEFSFLVDDQQDGGDEEEQEEGEVPPEAEYVPLVVDAVQDDALGLEVHAPLLDVDSAQVVVPKAAEARFRQKPLEALDHPLALKLRLIYHRLPDIPIQHHEPERLHHSEMLNYSQHHPFRQSHLQLLHLGELLLATPPLASQGDDGFPVLNISGLFTLFLLLEKHHILLDLRYVVGLLAHALKSIFIVIKYFPVRF